MFNTCPNKARDEFAPSFAQNFRNRLSEVNHDGVFLNHGRRISNAIIIAPLHGIKSDVKS